MPREIQIIAASHFIHEKGQFITTDIHKEYEIVFHFYGGGFENIDGKNYHFNTNSLAIILPGTPHDKLYTEVGDVVSVHFLAPDCFLKESGVFHMQDNEIHALFSRIRAEIDGQNPYRNQMLEHMLGELLILLSRKNQIPNPENNDIESAACFIDAHYREKIDFRKLAADCSYSYDRFRHIFKERMGNAPRDYMIARRLSHAKYLLETTRQSVTDIADACGFSNNAQFSAMFKRHFGEAPVAYRKQTKNQQESLV